MYVRQIVRRNVYKKLLNYIDFAELQYHFFPVYSTVTAILRHMIRIPFTFKNDVRTYDANNLKYDLILTFAVQ